MIEATIEIWSSKPTNYESYTIYQKDKFLREYKKSYKTTSSDQAMSFANRFVNTLRRSGKLDNDETIVIKIN